MVREVINLRNVRKAKHRAATRQTADENATRHGEAKPVKTLRSARQALEDRKLAEHRLDKKDAP